MRVSAQPIRFEDIDGNIVDLIKALNSFSGLFTTCSCGGHTNNTRHQLPAGEWEIFFSLEIEDEDKPSPAMDAWLSLEYLVYGFSKLFRPTSGEARINLHSSAPYLNGPGESLSFILEGRGSDPDEVARFLVDLRREVAQYYECDDE